MKKNLLISFRNKEFLVESILPIVVAGMLSLKGIFVKSMISLIISNLIADATIILYCFNFNLKINAYKNGRRKK